MKTVDNLKSRIRYQDGRLFWIDGRRAGKEIGLVDRSGYVWFKFAGRSVRRARVVLELHGVDLNGKEVDHINGNRSDDRLENLRAVSRAHNQQNRRNPQVNSHSGFLGVSMVGKNGRCIARIKVNGRHVHLGSFKCAEAAHAAYVAAKKELHPGYVA